MALDQSKRRKLKIVSSVVFTLLYVFVSCISTIHVVDFFLLSNERYMAIMLALAFEFGAAASLGSIIILENSNVKSFTKALIWVLFFTLTSYQAMGNAYYAFSNLTNYQGWIEMFNLLELEPLAQKRWLSIIQGAILPFIALGYIHIMTKFITPDSNIPTKSDDDDDDDYDYDDEYEDSDELDEAKAQDAEYEKVIENLEEELRLSKEKELEHENTVVSERKKMKNELQQAIKEAERRAADAEKQVKELKDQEDGVKKKLNPPQ